MKISMFILTLMIAGNVSSVAWGSSSYFDYINNLNRNTMQKNSLYVGSSEHSYSEYSNRGACHPPKRIAAILESHKSIESKKLYRQKTYDEYVNRL